MQKLGSLVLLLLLLATHKDQALDTSCCIALTRPGSDLSGSGERAAQEHKSSRLVGRHALLGKEGAPQVCGFHPEYAAFIDALSIPGTQRSQTKSLSHDVQYRHVLRCPALQHTHCSPAQKATGAIQASSPKHEVHETFDVAPPEKVQSFVVVEGVCTAQGR